MRTHRQRALLLVLLLLLLHRRSPICRDERHHARGWLVSLCSRLASKLDAKEALTARLKEEPLVHQNKRCRKVPLYLYVDNSKNTSKPNRH